MHLTWFYLHCIAAMAILWADATDRLEPAVNAFEMSIGLYTPPDTIDLTPPFYLPPTEQDSTWILPPIEGIDIPIDSNMVKV